MAGIFHPSRGGTRGGQDQFNWEDVKTDKDREYYLGHSLKASVGRWQEGKDLIWYTRDKNKTAEENEADAKRRKEIHDVKSMEARAMAAALGHKSQSSGSTSLTAKELEEVLSRTAASKRSIDAGVINEATVAESAADGSLKKKKKKEKKKKKKKKNKHKMKDKTDEDERIDEDEDRGERKVGRERKSSESWTHGNRNPAVVRESDRHRSAGVGSRDRKDYVDNARKERAHYEDPERRNENVGRDKSLRAEVKNRRSNDRRADERPSNNDHGLHRHRGNRRYNEVTTPRNDLKDGRGNERRCGDIRGDRRGDIRRDNDSRLHQKHENRRDEGRVERAYVRRRDDQQQSNKYRKRMHSSSDEEDVGTTSYGRRRGKISSDVENRKIDSSSQSESVSEGDTDSDSASDVKRKVKMKKKNSLSSSSAETSESDGESDSEPCVSDRIFRTKKKEKGQGQGGRPVMSQPNDSTRVNFVPKNQRLRHDTSDDESED